MHIQSQQRQSDFEWRIYIENHEGLPVKVQEVLDKTVFKSKQQEDYFVTVIGKLLELSSESAYQLATKIDEVVRESITNKEQEDRHSNVIRQVSYEMFFKTLMEDCIDFTLQANYLIR